MADTALPSGSILKVQSFPKLTSDLQASLGEFPLGIMDKMGVIMESVDEVMSRGGKENIPSTGVEANIPYVEKASPFGISYATNGASAANSLTITGLKVTCEGFRKTISVPASDNYTAIEMPNVLQSASFTEDLAISKGVTTVVEAFTYSVMNQLAGFNPLNTNNVILNGEITIPAGDAYAYRSFTGFNAVDEYDSSRIFRPLGVANDESLTSSHRLNAKHLDAVCAAIERAERPLQPCMLGSKPVYLMFVHPDCARDLEGILDTTYANFADYELAYIQGARKEPNENSPSSMYDSMGSSALGLWRNKLLIIVSRYVPYGVSSGGVVNVTSRRNFVVGQNALAFFSPYGTLTGNAFKAAAKMMAEQRNPGRARYALTPPLRVGREQYNVQLSNILDVRTIYGAKRLKFSGRPDVNSILVPTFASV